VSQKSNGGIGIHPLSGLFILTFWYSSSVWIIKVNNQADWRNIHYCWECRWPA